MAETDIRYEDFTSDKSISLNKDLNIEGGLSVLDYFDTLLKNGTATIGGKTMDLSDHPEIVTSIEENTASFSPMTETNWWTWDTPIGSTDTAGLYFTIWDIRHEQAQRISFSLGTHTITFGERTYKITNISAKDTFYLFGGYPFDLTSFPLAVVSGSHSAQRFIGNSGIEAHFFDTTGDDSTDAIRKFSSLPMDGSRPITNEELHSVFGGFTSVELRMDIRMKGTSLFGAYTDCPKLVIVPCYSLKSFRLPKRQEVSDDDKKNGLSTDRIPLDLFIQAKMNNSDDEGSYFSLSKGDKPTLRGLGVSLFATPKGVMAPISGKTRVAISMRPGTNAIGRVSTNLIGKGSAVVSATSQGITQSDIKSIDNMVINARATLESSQIVFFSPVDEDHRELNLVAIKGMPSRLGLQPAKKGNSYFLNGQSVPNIEKYSYFLVDESVTMRINGENHFKPSTPREAVHVYGAIDLGDDTKPASVILFDDWKPEYEGQGNMEVTFPSYNEDNASVVDKCTFGAFFGTNNAKNRLFVSGNEDHPNVDWHTAETGSDGDFTYVPDDSYCSYGEGSTKVTGYGIVSDGKLMVSTSYSSSEPSVYYRTATYKNATDSNGQTISVGGRAMVEETYPRANGSSHIGGVAPYLYTDFNGDMLFVSANDHSIVGLDLKGITYDSQRIASSRSYLIDSYITSKEVAPSDCRIFNDGKRAYYSTPDYLFVTDYELNKSRQTYEWFRLGVKGVNAMVFTNTGDFKTEETLIGSEDGIVYRKTDDWQDYSMLDVEYSTEIQFDSASGAYRLNQETSKKLVQGSFTEMWLFDRSGSRQRFAITDYVNDDTNGDTFGLAVPDDEPDHTSPNDEALKNAARIVLVKATPVNAYYITAPLLYEYAHAMKTIWSYTVFWETKDTSEVALAQATNEATMDKIIDTIKLGAPSIDLANVALGSVTFQKKRLPYLYTQYSPFKAPFVSLCLSSSGNSDSVLTQVQFSYSYSGQRYTGDSRS